jgi:hypothetical protein
MGWSIMKILEEPISYTQMIGIPENEILKNQGRAEQTF